MFYLIAVDADDGNGDGVRDEVSTGADHHGDQCERWCHFSRHGDGEGDQFAQVTHHSSEVVQHHSFGRYLATVNQTYLCQLGLGPDWALNSFKQL